MNPSSTNPSSGTLDRETLGRLRSLAQDTDPALFAEILSAFLGDLKKYLAEIHRSLAENAAATLGHNAHAIKGASINIGALQLVRLSSRMEEAAEAGDLSIVPAMLAELETEIRRVQADIALELSAAA